MNYANNYSADRYISFGRGGYEYSLHFPPPPSMRRVVSSAEGTVRASSRMRGICILIATSEREGKETGRLCLLFPTLGRKGGGLLSRSLVDTNNITSLVYRGEKDVPKDVRNRACSPRDR